MKEIENINSGYDMRSGKIDTNNNDNSGWKEKLMSNELRVQLSQTMEQDLEDLGLEVEVKQIPKLPPLPKMTRKMKTAKRKPPPLPKNTQK